MWSLVDKLVIHIEKYAATCVKSLDQLWQSFRCFLPMIDLLAALEKNLQFQVDIKQQWKLYKEEVWLM